MRNTTIRRFMIEGRKSAPLWKGSHQCHPKSILQVFYPQFSFWGSSHQALAIAALTFTTELFAEMLLIAYWETICPEHSSFTLSWTSSTTWSFLKGPVSHYVYICTHKKQHVVFLLAQIRWLLPETTVGFVQCLWGRMHKLEIQRHKAPGGVEHMNMWPSSPWLLLLLEKACGVLLMMSTREIPKRVSRAHRPRTTCLVHTRQLFSQVICGDC